LRAEENNKGGGEREIEGVVLETAGNLRNLQNIALMLP